MEHKAATFKYIYMLKCRHLIIYSWYITFNLFRSADYGKSFKEYNFGQNTKVSYFYVSKTDFTKVCKPALSITISISITMAIPMLKTYFTFVF